MNARISFLAAAAVAATLAVVPTAAVAQSAFEGVVTFQVDGGPEGPQTMQYSIKGPKVRMDVSARGMEMFILYDGTAKTVDMVIPMQQMYTQRSVDNAQAMVDSAADKTKIVWTGNKETIAGYECEHANITDSRGQTTDVCLTKALGTFVQMNGGMGGRGRGRGGMGGGWEGHIGQTFPLKVVSNGKVEMEVTKVEKKSLDDAIFSVPAGYRKMTMPMGGRGGR